MFILCKVTQKLFAYSNLRVCSEYILFRLFDINENITIDRALFA